MQFLVLRGASVNASKCGCTALHRACARGRIEIVKVLLQQPLIRVNERDTSTGDERTPLAKAVVNGHLSIVELLLQAKGVDINALDSRNHSIWQLGSPEMRIKLEAAGVTPCQST